MRFDEVPQNRQEERPQIQVPATTMAAGKKQEQRGEERAQEIKRRID